MFSFQTRRLRSQHALPCSAFPTFLQMQKKNHIFPALASGSLLSIGQLCNHGCSVYFDKSKLYILNNGRIVMQCTRDHTCLWTINNPQETTHSLNSVINAPIIAERIKFYNASIFSPALSTVAQAISTGFLTPFPAFITKQLRKYSSVSLATQMVHLHAKKEQPQAHSQNQAQTNHQYCCASPSD